MSLLYCWIEYTCKEFRKAIFAIAWVYLLCLILMDHCSNTKKEFYVSKLLIPNWFSSALSLEYFWDIITLTSLFCVKGKGKSSTSIPNSQLAPELLLGALLMKSKNELTKRQWWPLQWISRQWWSYSIAPCVYDSLQYEFLSPHIKVLTILHPLNLPWPCHLLLPKECDSVNG